MHVPLLQQHLFSDDVFTGVRAGQPVTHMRSTNSKPQPFNQFRFMPSICLLEFDCQITHWKNLNGK